MQQGDNEVSFDICYDDPSYTATMDTWYQEGMVLAISLWGIIAIFSLKGKFLPNVSIPISFFTVP